MGFLIFTIDSLAWPVLALGYPLCASIRAIETGSKYHMRKLVTYWTIFSFISLFEHLFEKLIERVPLWLYIKLIIVCWLVIPQFKGSCYIYQYLIHPCFSVKLHNVITQYFGSCYVCQRLLYLCLFVNLQTVTDWLSKPTEDPSLKIETFLTVAERFLEENEYDALEKLIANKSKNYSLNHNTEEIKTTYTSDEAGILTRNQTEREVGGRVWEDIKVMEHMTKHEAAESKPVKSVRENIIQNEKTTTGLTVRETVVTANAEEVKHREKCEELKKTDKQIAGSEGSSCFTAKSVQLNQEEVKRAALAQEHSTNGAADPKQVKTVKKQTVETEKKIKGVEVRETVVQSNAEETKHPEITCSKQVQKEWTCAVCQVATTSEHDLKCHLLGKRHRGKCEELKAYKKMAKTERSLPCTSNTRDQHKQEQVKVKHALAACRKHSTNGGPKEGVKLGAAGKNEKQKQVKNAGATVHNPRPWCRFCNIRCPGEIAMAAHLNGRKHLAKLQET